MIHVGYMKDYTNGGYDKHMKNGKLALLISMIFVIQTVSACGATSRSTFSNAGGVNCEIKTDNVKEHEEDSGIAEYGDELADCKKEISSLQYDEDFNTEEYNIVKEHGFRKVSLEPLSTFSADVDTGSYPNLRRMLNNCEKIDNIPSGAIRAEEMLNYFDWDTSKAEDKGQFKVKYELANSPWNDNVILLATIEADSKSKTGNNNFVFLIDTSSSMRDDDKMGLVVKSLKDLAWTLTENDRVSVVTYAGSTDTLLDSCNGNDTRRICKALDKAEELCNSYGGGTNGSGGIEAAYEIASKNYIDGGNNRVIIASDGDMNLGIADQSGLVDLVKSYKDTGIYLTTLGFGEGNYSDANMEQIADNGNGNYFYIDCESEAKRVLVDKMKQNTDVVAKDTKLQIEFNPSKVYSYRQIGYENRQMAASDFEDDKKDGGEVGAGQQVTIMYELVLGNGTYSSLKYQKTKASNSNELATLAIRYQEQNTTGGKSKLIEFPIISNVSNKYSTDMNFALGIAETGLLIKNSEYKDGCTYEDALALLKAGSNNDKYREELFKLIKESSNAKVSDYSEVGSNRMNYTHKPDIEK